MAKYHEESDYFVPILAPYVQWVRAYRDLIRALYEEHKTVKRTWRAFREAIPGVEQRLEFGLFEQILLFSLFMSEWNEGSEERPPVQKVSRANPDRGGYERNTAGPGPDAVIQELRDISAERDKALWNLKHFEEKVDLLKAEKEALENQVKSFEIHFEMLRNELDTANENLNTVIHQLDTQKEENAGLRLKVAGLSRKRASLEERIQKLLKKSTGPAASMMESAQLSALNAPKVAQGVSQMVIQWAGQDTVRTGEPGVARNSKSSIPSKKIDRWNAQRSKDGYYRLYRKIRGRVHSIYIGKELDIDKARRRIAEKEKKLLGVNPAVEP
jgi:chaperonin cofactor prefoldin